MDYTEHKAMLKTEMEKAAAAEKGKAGGPGK